MLKIEGDIPYSCSRNSYSAIAARKAFWVKVDLFNRLLAFKSNTSTKRVDTASLYIAKTRLLDLMFCKASHV